MPLSQNCQNTEFFWSVCSRIILNTEIYGEFSPNTRKYGPEKLRIWTLCMQCVPDKAYAGPSQAFKIDLHARIVDYFKLTLLTISAKYSIVDVWRLNTSLTCFNASNCLNGTKYSRVGQEKFVEDSLYPCLPVRLLRRNSLNKFMLHLLSQLIKPPAKHVQTKLSKQSLCIFL